MRRSVRILAVTALTVLAATACGGGGKTDATTNAAANSAAPAAAGEQSTGSDDAMAADDGDDDKIAQGTDLDKAKEAGLGSDNAPVISVTGTDTTCDRDTKTVKAGKIWVKFTNSGKKISEVYLETADGEKLAEVERIKSGESGAFTFEVKQGKYQLACQPGMDADKALQVPLTVE